MRILHLLYESTGDYFGIGGVGTRAYEIYRYLKSNHDVTLLCKKYPGAKDGEREGLKHLFVGTESRSLMPTLLSYAFHAAQFVRKNAQAYDVIIEEFSAAIPTFLHTCTEKPIILQMQGYTGKLYFRKYNPLYASVLSALELLRPGFYDHFIFISRESARSFRVGSNKHSRIIPNGVPRELLNVPLDDGVYILYLGRIDMYGKGLDILLDAYKEFYQTFPNVRLVIAGDGRDAERFKAALTKLPEHVKSNIELPGWVSADKKVKVLSRAMVCVFPSRHEVQPLAALEAMACGKPLIVSDIPEFGFVRERGAGLSFKTGDAISLARAMQDMVTHNERKEMGKKGREWAKGFTWERIATEYERFLEQVMRGET